MTVSRSMLLLATLSFFATSANAAKPNVVVFLADDLGWADCSPNGGKAVPTPNMAKLAEQGMTFSRAFVSSPSCAPSRAALLTGLDPMKNGSMLNHAEPKPDIQRWPKYFQELGYEVVAIGKVAHYNQVTKYGFDHASHFKYHEDVCVGEAVKWLKARTSDKPLCLIVGTNWPHVPWPEKSRLDPATLDVPAKWIDTPEFRKVLGQYYEAVANADRDLGMVREAVVEKLGENVIFAFTADHGAQMPFGKWNCYDAGLRIPLIVSWPDKVKAASKTDAMVGWIDILPTLLDACGAKPPEALTGRSFLPVLTGDKNTHRELVFGTHSADAKFNRYPMRTVRTADFRYVRNLDPKAEHHSHIDGDGKGEGAKYWPSWVEKAKRDPTAKAILDHYYTRPAEELYDFRTDPAELSNVAGNPKHAEVLIKLRGEVDAWMKANGDNGLKLEKALLEKLDVKNKLE